MERQWRIRRQQLAMPDGQRRWDRAYQHLVSWTLPSTPSPVVPAGEDQRLELEGEHGRSDLRAGVDAAAGAGTDD